MGAVFGCVGSIDGERREEILSNMASSMGFRGDKKLQVMEGGIGLATIQHDFEEGNRLVRHPHLPVIAACEGEIYNCDELSRSLKHPPDESFDNSGFSLVPYLYAEHGIDFPRAINGIFSIALWDEKERKLYLVRDHLGSHSIFFSRNSGNTFFASTAKALLDTHLVSTEININSLNKYLANLAISPPYTIFKDVYAVRPGYITVVGGEGKVVEYPYWPISSISEDFQTSRAELIERIKELFIDAVCIRAKSHDTLSSGALISGGIDTSSIVSVLHKNGLIRGLKGFSIDFQEAAYSDGSLQEYVYKEYDIVRNQVILGPEEWSEMLILGASFLDNPVNDVAYAGMLAAMKRAKENGCRIVYDGEASDEFFSTGHSHGERSIQKYLVIPFWLRRFFLGGFVPLFSHGSSYTNKVMRLLARIGMSDLERRSNWVPAFPYKDRAKLLADLCPENLPDPYDIAREYYGVCRQNDSLNMYQFGLSRLFLPDDLLYKNERVAASQGIINRTPFIDYRFVELAFQVPAQYKIRKPTEDSDGTKLIFKDAITGVIPDEILYRKKTRGFGQPAGVWFRGPLKDFVHDHLFGTKAKVTQYLDQGAVKEIYDDHMSGNVASDYYLNSLVILELWMRSYV